MEENNKKSTKNTFQNTVSSLMQGMESFISTKTVVGDPIEVGRSIILPLVDVSFGMGAGSFAGEKKRNASGGIGGKISPSAVLVIQDGYTKLISVKNQDGIAKLLDMIPDFIDSFRKKREFKKNPEKAQEYQEARDAAEADLKDKLDLE